jgi:hypothetical protein
MCGAVLDLQRLRSGLSSECVVGDLAHRVGDLGAEPRRISSKVVSVSSTVSWSTAAISVRVSTIPPSTARVRARAIGWLMYGLASTSLLPLLAVLVRGEGQGLEELRFDRRPFHRRVPPWSARLSHSSAADTGSRAAPGAAPSYGIGRGPPTLRIEGSPWRPSMTARISKPAAAT